MDPTYWAKWTPDAPAVTLEANTSSYADLADRAARVTPRHRLEDDMSETWVDILGLDPVDVLRALWTNAQPRSLPQVPEPMSRERARELFAQHPDGRFDSVDDRSVKVRFDGDNLEVSRYDHDHGRGIGRAVVARLRTTGSVGLLPRA